MAVPEQAGSDNSESQRRMEQAIIPGSGGIIGRMTAAVSSAKAKPARPARGIPLTCMMFLLVGSTAGGADGETVYDLIPGESELRVLVFRAGSLARLGHNHVVSTTDISGSAVVGASPMDSRLDMIVPVRSFTVDDPAALEEVGGAFSGERSEGDIEGTRRNMLGPDLLHAEEYEEVRVVSDRISGDFPEVTIEARVTVKGSEYVLALPAFVSIRDGNLVARGSAEVAHSDLGLSPFEAAFGALRVAEDLIFRYRIVARESSAADTTATPARPAADTE